MDGTLSPKLFVAVRRPKHSGIAAVLGLRGLCRRCGAASNHLRSISHRALPGARGLMQQHGPGLQTETNSCGS
jgi:hypothetical protein